MSIGLKGGQWSLLDSVGEIWGPLVRGEGGSDRKWTRDIHQKVRDTILVLTLQFKFVDPKYFLNVGFLAQKEFKI